MKISVVTITYNSAATLRDTIESVLAQDYKNIEYLIIDGGSTDETIDIIKSYSDDRIKWISEPDKGIYDAMSKGKRMATGNVVGVLNSDDFYPNSQVLDRVAHAFTNETVDAVYGDLKYVDHQDVSRITRNWVSGIYDRENFLRGWMPPHPTFFLKKAAFEKYGYYNPDFKSAGDYELILRMLFKNNLKALYIPHVQVTMRAGGVSNSSIKNRIRANQEDRQAWKLNGIKPKWYTLFMKPLSKLQQWF
ncbi:MAG: glycosyltransferase involved in cell wall biosynthesis [Spirosomataceae bacterium]|jgi:glycosyltransferase involved in cell wall biosynthesis